MLNTMNTPDWKKKQSDIYTVDIQEAGGITPPETPETINKYHIKRFMGPLIQ